MANRQYIGARYVPKIYQGTNGNNWDSGVEYEALTVVTYLHNSYTSKKPVPARTVTPNLDTEYWVATGLYNAQIGELTEDITALQNELNALENTVAHINDINLIMIGDSYGEQSDGSISEWYWEYIRDFLGLTENTTFRHRFTSGAGFGNEDFLENLQYVATGMTTDEKNAVTDIFVCGGWNDSNISQPYGTDEAFNAGTLAFKNYANTNFPNARISVAHIAWGRRDSRQDHDEISRQLPLSLSRYSQLGVRGFRYITNSEYILHRKDAWQSDGAHPNQTGQGYLGIYLTEGFINGSVDVNYKTLTTSMITVPNTIPISNNYNIVKETLHNNVVTVEINSHQCYIEPGSMTFECNGVTNYRIFGADLMYVMGDYSGKQTVPIRIYDGTKWRIAEGTISIYNNVIDLTLALPNSDGTALENNITFQYLFIPYVTFTMDTYSC